MRILLFLLLLTNYCFSQQILEFCYEDTIKTTTYSTNAGTPGNYYWSLDQGTYVNYGTDYTITWTNDDEGTHKISVYFEDLTGCVSEPINIYVTINICKISNVWAPNCFTPNGDQNNNIWVIKSENCYDPYYVIYNRWGEPVFESHDLNIGWDGYYNGKICSEGVYFYLITWKDGKNYYQKQTGQITLIR